MRTGRSATIVFSALVASAIGITPRAAASTPLLWERLKYPYSVKIEDEFSFYSFLFSKAISGAVADLNGNTDIVATEDKGVVTSDVVVHIADFCMDDTSILGRAEHFALDEGILKSCRHQSSEVDCGGLDKVVYVRIIINCEHPHFTRDPNNYSIRRRVVTHELGHAASLAHPSGCSPSSVMKWNVYCSGQREFTADDITAINSTY